MIDKCTTTKEVVRTIIIPETANAQVGSYMKIMPGGPKKPRTLVSHWWGASFYDDILCIAKHATGLVGKDLRNLVDDAKGEEHVRNGELDCTYWMCIFAVNEHASICGDCINCRAVYEAENSNFCAAVFASFRGPCCVTRLVARKWSSQMFQEDSCRNCGETKRNPCKCGALKFSTGHPLCEVDKFDGVMEELGSLLVALDPDLRTLTRIWCVSEIGTSIRRGYPIDYQVPEKISFSLFGTNVTMKIPKLGDCDAAYDEDKDRIIQDISEHVGCDKFEDLVSEGVMPQIMHLASDIAVRNRNTVALHDLLGKRADPNFQSLQEESLLEIAARSGFADICGLLVQAAADVNLAVGWRQSTPLLVAAGNGEIGCVSALLKARADANLVTDEGSHGRPGRAPLREAVLSLKTDLKTDCVAALLKAKANVNLAGSDLLSMNIGLLDIECIIALLEAAVDVNAADRDGRTALYCAVCSGRGNADRVTAILDKRANASLACNKRKTPLHMAAPFEQIDCVIALIKAEGAVNLKDIEGRTPLWDAARHGRTNSVAVLLKAASNVNLADDDGCTPLGVATAQGNTDCVTALLQALADVNLIGCEGQTLLCWFAGGGKTECISTLLEAAALINLADMDGRTPLYQAVYQGETDCVTALLQRAADVNLADKDGWTPLHRALQEATNCVSALLKAAANVNLANTWGMTPLSIATDTGKVDCVVALLERAADANLSDKNGFTPLWVSARDGKVDCILALIKAAAGLNLCSNSGRTPIFIAAEMGNIGCVIALLKAHADATKETETGETPLSIAKSKNQSEVVRVLER